MRRLKDLNKDSQARIRKYVAQWPTIDTKQLAVDLYLEPTSVAAIKAHLTRNRDRKFNELLS